VLGIRRHDRDNRSRPLLGKSDGILSEDASEVKKNFDRAAGSVSDQKELPALTEGYGVIEKFGGLALAGFAREVSGRVGCFFCASLLRLVSPTEPVETLLAADVRRGFCELLWWTTAAPVELFFDGALA